MNKTEIISLLKLLEDPDENVFNILREQILDKSELFHVYLENYHALSINELALKRSEILLDEIFIENLEKRLIKVLKTKGQNLLDAVLIIEEYFNRDIDAEQIKEETNKIIQSIWLELNDQLTGIEKVKLIGNVLFEKLNFKKYPVGEFKPRYLSFANCINDRKYVSPNIALLYCIIAQETSLPLFPIDLPGIFLLSYVDKELANAVFEDNNNGAVFYIYPYDQGEFINHQILEKYLKEQKTTQKIEQMKNMTYTDFLAFFFQLRTYALKQKKYNGFEIDYADRIIAIFKNINL
ncbi:MAG: transglutaminase family protein [Bacteroidales bacterium]|nr:transglutaminase family protein [Bacteroidales bacterium]MDD4216018.1 transglutaminase family protein [Bacteroidales bacterium]MDY0140291.1 transglutaminase family protein [Bacteroidales bacterium]